MSAPKLNDLGAQNQAPDIAVEVKVTKREIKYVMFVRTFSESQCLYQLSRMKINKTSADPSGSVH